MDNIRHRTLSFLRLLVLLLFAAVCFQTGYNAGYNTGESADFKRQIGDARAGWTDAPVSQFRPPAHAAGPAPAPAKAVASRVPAPTPPGPLARRDDEPAF